MTLSFMHISDLHFGMARYGTDPNTGLSRDHTSSVRVLQAAVSTAIENQVNAIVLSGDQFDTGHPPMHALTAMAATLTPALQAGIAVVLLEGNHELIGRPFRGNSPNETLAAMLSAHGEVILTPATPKGIRLSCGLQVVAMPWINKPRKLWQMARESSTPLGASTEATDALLVEDFTREFMEIVGRADHSMPLIALSHVTVDANMRHGSEEELCRHKFSEPIIPTRVFDESGVQYAALGHIHAAASVSPICHYAGSLDRLTFADADTPKGAVIVTYPDTLSPVIQQCSMPARDMQRLTLETASQIRPNAFIELTLEPGQRDVPPAILQKISDMDAYLAKVVTSPAVAKVSQAPSIAENTNVNDALNEWLTKNPSHLSDDMVRQCAREVMASS